MPAISLPSVSTASPETQDDYLIGVQGGALKRFAIGSVLSELAGAGISFLGDSITATNNADGQWVKWLCKQLGATYIANHAASGRVMRDCAKDASSVALDAADLATTDLVILFAGTNDFNAARVGGIGALLGTMADSASYAANSFYANTKYVVETIYGLKPSVRMVMFTPLYRAGALPATTPTAEGKVLADYADAVIQVGASYGVPVLDLYRMSGLNSFNESLYLSDGLHPNVADSGRTIIGRPAAGWLRSIY